MAATPPESEADWEVSYDNLKSLATTAAEGGGEGGSAGTAGREKRPKGGLLKAW